MDPFSVTASVITVIQAAEAVIIICYNYRSAIKGSSWDQSRVLEGVRSLRNVLQTLEALADKAETSDEDRLPVLKSLCHPDEGTLSECYAELRKLETKLAPPGWSGPEGSKRRALLETLSWPLKKGDTERFLENIEKLKSTINLAVNVDQT